MRDQFVPYELAVKLKELGFKDKCLGSYDLNKDFYIGGSDYKINIWINAPLWQQAFDWFREKYMLNNVIKSDSFNNGRWEYVINSIDKSMVLDKIYDSPYWVREGTFHTYQEARQDCLEKLIELVQK